jgi:cell division protein FtsB
VKIKYLTVIILFFFLKKGLKMSLWQYDELPLDVRPTQKTNTTLKKENYNKKNKC